jgi:hypothetical protein
MWCLAIDKVTAEVIGLFEARQIDVLLVKGPVIASWLYPGEVRPYSDGDLLISRRDWNDAVSILEAEGFTDYLRPLAHPRMESFAGTGFLRGSDSVDLHATLPGLHADPDEIWAILWETAVTQEIAGRLVRVPGRAAVLMHIALHAAQHVVGKPTEDLVRASTLADDIDWRAAAALASRLGGLEAFATGMRAVPQAESVATRLGLSDVGSIKFDLRRAQVPLAEGLNDLLGAPLSKKPGIIVRELAPSASFMRWAMPVARRGRVGLIASYPLRWLMLLRGLPRALASVYRVRKQRKQ